MGIKRSLALAVTCASLFALTANAADKEVETPKAESAKPGVTYKGVNLQLGGFLASETVYRTNNTASDIATAYAKIPFQNNPANGMGEFRTTERQSRISLLAQGDVNSTTHLAGYYETDFLGTSPQSNANQSNSYTMRTRNIYAQIDWEEIGLHLLAGQNWSLLTMNTKGITPRNELIPATIDAQYVVGFNWERQAQLRLVKDWSKTYWLALSLENAQTVGVGGSAASGTGNNYTVPAGQLMSTAMSYQSAPDVIAKFAWESSFGHYEVSALARNFQSRYGGTTVATQSTKQNQWTEAVGIGATIPVWPKNIDVSVSGLYGKGIGRYGTSQLPDTTFASDGSLDPLLGAQGLIQAAYHVNPHWEAWLAFGMEQVNGNGGSGYGYGDGAVADNSGCSNLGGTCTPNLKSVSQINAAAWWSFYKGEYGAAKLGFEYSHTSLNTYADANGSSPSTSIDNFYTSLRYYPF